MIKLNYLMLFFFIPLFLIAQNQGGILTGHISDKSTKQPIIGANILIIGTMGGTTSDADGNFSLKNLTPGNYSLRISYLGYRELIKSDIIVNNVSFQKMNIELEPVDLSLNEITVTADYYQKNSDAVTSLQSFSYEEIRRAPGGLEDVVRAVSTVPGVGTQQNRRNDLIVRGGGPSENLFLIDGLEIQNINHFGTQGATGGPLTLVNVDFVENTDFSTGGFGVRYGDKLSSVMNISLREGRTDRLGGKATISATQFGANLEGPVGSDGNFLFSVRRSYLDWIFKAAGFGFIPEYWDFQGKYVQRINAENRLEFFGIAALDNVITNNDTQEKKVSNSRLLGTDQNQYVLGVTWKRFFENGFINTTLGRSYSSFDSRQSDSNLVSIFTNTSFEEENSIRSEWIGKFFTDGELTIGAQYKLVRSNSTLNIPGFVTSYGDSLVISNRENSLTANKAGIYTQIANQFHNLDYVFGIRTDYFSALKNQFSFSPRFSAGYNFLEKHRLTFSTGLYHQSPSYVWLINNSSNKSLDQLQSVQTIFGYEYLIKPDLKFKVEFYNKSYENYPVSLERPYLILANTGSGFSNDGFTNFGFDNLVSEGKGYARGIEFQVQKKLSEFKLYGIAALSINQSKYIPLNGIEYDGSYSQPVIFNLSGGYQINSEWEVSVKFRAASGLPYTPFNSDGTQSVSKYNSERFDWIHQLDLRTDKRWNFLTWNLITYVDIQNVYNQKNQFDLQWDNQKNEILKQKGIGILPSIGVTAEF